MADSLAKLNVLVSLRSAIQDGDRPIEWLKKFTLGLTAAGGALGILAGKQALNLGGQITDLAMQANMGAQAFQTLAAVGSESGVAMEGIAKASEKLRKALQEARENGASPLNADLATLKLTAAGLQALAPERQWEQIAQSVGRATDKQAALNAAAALFGEKNLPKLHEVLSRLNTEGFDKLSDLSRNLRVSDEDLKTLDDAGDKLIRITTQLKVVAAKATAGILDSPIAQILGIGLGNGGQNLDAEKRLEVATKLLEQWKRLDPGGFMERRWTEEVQQLTATLRNLRDDPRAEQTLIVKDNNERARQAVTRETMAAAERRDREISEGLTAGLAESNSERERANMAATQAIELQRESERVFSATRSPLEQYTAEIERLGVLLQENVIAQETFNRAVDQAGIKLASATSLPNAENALNAQLLNISRQRALLEGDYTQTAAEKWGQRRQLLFDEIAARQKLLETLRQMRGASTSAEGAAFFDQRISGATEQLGGLQGQASQLTADPNSWAAQARVGLTQLRESWGTTAQQIGGLIQGRIGRSIDVVSEGITGLITGTTTWNGVLANVSQTIVTDVVQSIVRMFTTWVAQRGLAALAGMAWSAKEGAVDVVAKAPGALLTSITSFGAAAAIGVAALVAAMAAFGGFKKGGFTTDGPADQPAGVVHAGEWVAPQWMVEDSRYGGLIAGLEAARSGAPGFKTGGMFNPGSGTSKFLTTLLTTGIDTNILNYYKYLKRDPGSPSFTYDHNSGQWMDTVSGAAGGPGVGSDAFSAAKSTSVGADGMVDKDTRVLVVDHREEDLIARVISDPRFETRVRRIGRRYPGDFGSAT